MVKGNKNIIQNEVIDLYNPDRLLMEAARELVVCVAVVVMVEGGPGEGVTFEKKETIKKRANG